MEAQPTGIYWKNGDNSLTGNCRHHVAEKEKQVVVITKRAALIVSTRKLVVTENFWVDTSISLLVFGLTS